MAFLHLADNYNDHPKFRALSDGAFRLWHQGMGFCRMYQTDGLIPAQTVREFRAYTRGRLAELTRPCLTGATPLWEKSEMGDITVHDYLHWNDSKAEQAADREAARARMRTLREARVRPNSARTSSERALRTSAERAPRTSAEVPREEKRREEKILDPEEKEKDAEPKKYTAHDVETDAAAILDAFRAQWRSCYGHECSILITALQHMQLVEQATQHPVAELLRAVAAFFASSDAYVTQAKHPWALWIRDPLKYLATAKVAPDFQAELAAIVAKGPSVRPS